MARKLIRDFIPSLSHEADGLILQVWDGMRVWNGGVEHRVHGTRRAWIPAHWPFSPLTIPHECMPFPPLPSPPSPPFPSLPFPSLASASLSLFSRLSADDPRSSSLREAVQVEVCAPQLRGLQVAVHLGLSRRGGKSVTRGVNPMRLWKLTTPPSRPSPPLLPSTPAELPAASSHPPPPFLPAPPFRLLPASA